MRKEYDCLFRSRGRSTKHEVTELLKSEVFMRRMISADNCSNVMLSQYMCCVVPLLRCKTRLGATEWCIYMRVGSDTAAGAVSPSSDCVLGAAG
jgi:hypothetical protein